MNETLTQLLGSTEALLVALVLNAVGWVIKKTPLDNRFIPLCLCLSGGALYPWLTKWTGENVLLGIVVGAGAVGFHQLYVQHFDATNKEPDAKPNP